MTWDDFYERFYNLSHSTQKRYSYKLTDYGPADEEPELRLIITESCGTMVAVMVTVHIALHIMAIAMTVGIMATIINMDVSFVVTVAVDTWIDARNLKNIHQFYICIPN